MPDFYSAQDAEVGLPELFLRSSDGGFAWMGMRMGPGRLVTIAAAMVLTDEVHGVTEREMACEFHNPVGIVLFTRNSVMQVTSWCDPQHNSQDPDCRS